VFRAIVAAIHALDLESQGTPGWEERTLPGKGSLLKKSPEKAVYLFGAKL